MTPSKSANFCQDKPSGKYKMQEQGHIPILIHAWAYILSTRWTELIHEAQLSQSWPYNVNQDSGTRLNTGNSSTEVDIGEVEEDAAQWWSAVLSNDGGWDPTIQGPNGKPLYSPWSIRPVLNGSFTIATKITTRSCEAVQTPTSSAAACGYLSDYCSLHDIEDQKLVALMAALLIPVAK
ncbi:hypothetical protein ACKAV7_007983 [Fusarium commune]